MGVDVVYVEGRDGGHGLLADDLLRAAYPFSRHASAVRDA